MNESVAAAIERNYRASVPTHWQEDGETFEVVS